MNLFNRLDKAKQRTYVFCRFPETWFTSLHNSKDPLDAQYDRRSSVLFSCFLQRQALLACPSFLKCVFLLAPMTSLPLFSSLAWLSILFLFLFLLCLPLNAGSFQGSCPSHLFLLHPTPVSLFTIYWLLLLDLYFSLFYIWRWNNTSLVGCPISTLSPSGFILEQDHLSRKGGS